MAGGTYWNKFFVGGLYEEEHRDGKIEQRHYIPTPVGVIGVWLTKTDGSQSRQYMVNDHLGSSSLVVTEDGSTISEYSYDAWGNPRNPDNWALPLSDWPDYLADRGYTGHEMLAKIKLVHMNARIYDPVLGRFLSPDTYIQFEYNQQSYNRYSYVINNPMRYTDPSGNFIQFIPMILAAAGVEFSTTGFICAVMAASAADVLVHGGTIGQALKAAAISGAAAYIGGQIIGDNFGSFMEHGVMGEIGRAVAHGLVSGAASSAGGGNFGSGFLAGAVGSFAGELSTTYTDPGSLGGYLTAAIAGGTVSAIGGGKFANDAVSKIYANAASLGYDSIDIVFMGHGWGELTELSAGVFVDSPGVKMGNVRLLATDNVFRNLTANRKIGGDFIIGGCMSASPVAGKTSLWQNAASSAGVRIYGSTQNVSGRALKSHSFYDAVSSKNAAGATTPWRYYE